MLIDLTVGRAAQNQDRKDISIMIELTLPTMTCGHCVRTVTETVQRVDAGAQLKIDLPAHQVRIESNVPAATFMAALTEEGYAPA
jgi:copper chaperone